MIKSVENREPFLFLAGSWFAAAFSIPVLLLWMQSGQSVAHFLFFVFPPIAVSFLCGEAFGSDLLKPGLVQTSKEALLKGLKIFLLTYGYLSPIVALAYAVYFCLFQRDPHEWLTVQFVERIFMGFGLTIIGFLAVGWIPAILGALASWILYKFRLFTE